MNKTLIHPTAIISPKAKIAKGVSIGAYSVVGDSVTLEADVTIDSHVIIDGNTHVGEKTKISSFCVIGTQPQFIGDIKPSKVLIGKNNQIREHVTIHSGTEKNGTTLGDNCLIMVASHIAHDCHVGNGVWMANNATLGGHVEIGDHVIIGGLSGIHQKVRLGRGCIIGGLSGVEGDVIPYGSVMGNRARLSGLNLVGLRRRGVERDRIHTLRAAYRLLFADEGTLTERVEDALKLFKGDQIALEVIEFLKQNAKNNLRPLCLPR